ncbi:hypothetical protein FRC12_004624 [Ceratobasidium sp. 428]|nr:hypothetical protein FRC12_004624 [Ceratobasidium sp. 428]
MGQSRSLPSSLPSPTLRSFPRLPRTSAHEEDTSLTFDHAIPLPPATHTAASQFMDEMEKNSNFNAGELERLKRRFMKLDA